MFPAPHHFFCLSAAAPCNCLFELHGSYHNDCGFANSRSNSSSPLQSDLQSDNLVMSWRTGLRPRGGCQCFKGLPVVLTSHSSIVEHVRSLGRMNSINITSYHRSYGFFQCLREYPTRCRSIGEPGSRPNGRPQLHSFSTSSR